MVLETLTVRREGSVLFADIAAPPMNLLGPELVRDLVTLIQDAEADDTVQVLVFASADPDYFISHVDLNRISEVPRGGREADRRSVDRIALPPSERQPPRDDRQDRGAGPAAGSEFVLACDMRFAARESAIFSQFEPAFGLLPGGGAAQHLTRLMGRARALEVMLSAQDYDAELAERYGWINRALPADELDDFVRSLAHQIARIPGHRPRRGQGSRQLDRARTGGGLPPRFRYLRRGRAHPRGAKPNPSRDGARLANPRCGDDPGPDLERFRRPLTLPEIKRARSGGRGCRCLPAHPSHPVVALPARP